MDKIINLLRELAGSAGMLGNVPRPIRIVLTFFVAFVPFVVIFKYANLDHNEKIYLGIAAAALAVFIGGYYAWKGLAARAGTRSSGEESFWSAPPQSRAPSVSEVRSRPEPRPALGPQPSSAPPTRVATTKPLLELAEPLFQYMCRLNRFARRGVGAKAPGDTSFASLAKTGASAPAAPGRGADLDYTVVRSEIKALLEDMMSKASSDMRLSHQAGKVELPLIFFVDSMIAESGLPFAAEWNQNRLAYDRQELAGDEKFFDLLDETLKENAEDAAERLAVFYVCIGLGFSGIYFKQPELLRKTMLGIAPRIRHLVENDQSARICPETYEGVDTRNLVQPPGDRLVFVGMVFACFTLAVVASYVIMYRQASKNLNTSIEEVLRQDPAAELAK